jgi:hypothetical protein
MKIVVPYELAFTNIVSSFIEETAVCYGADEQEQKRMRLLGEEAFLFIIGGIPDVEFHEMFHLNTFEEEDGLGFQFSNHGQPMNVREVPEFSIEDPEGTADGLSLNLLKNLCDELLFRSLGREGWELMIRVKFKNYRKILPVERQLVAGSMVAGVTGIICRRTTPEDIPGIINLVYNTYRYSYVKPMMYDKDLFTEAIGEGNLLSIVAVTSEGKVVGHNAIMIDSARLGEAGMAMIDPDYRGGQLFRMLIKVTRDEIVPMHPGMLYYARAVTTHKASQAFAARFTPTLLSLSLLPNLAFIGINSGGTDRESTIHLITKQAEVDHAGKLFIPSEHFELISGMFSDEGISVDLMTNSGSIAQIETKSTVVRIDEEQHAEIVLDCPGNDLEKHIRQLTRMLQQEGIITVDIFIRTRENLPENLDAVLIEKGYFFCGIKPMPDGSWQVVYTNLLNQKFDFENLQLFSAKSNALRDYVKLQYQKTA